MSTDLQLGARFGLASATFPYVILTEIGAQQGDTQEAKTQETTRPESGTALAPHVTGDTDSAPGPSAGRPAGTHSLPHRFHPEESLVAVFVRSGRVILAARLDLSSDADADELAEFIDALAKREGAEALALVGYGAASLPTNRLLTQLMDRLVEQELTDVLYVGHGRWWSLTCADDCCPLAGTPLDLTSHPLSATAVLAGLGTRTNRRELEESVNGPARDELPRVDAMVETMLAERAELADHGDAALLLASMIDKVLADPNILDEERCLLLGLLVRDVHLRDLAWALLTPTTADDHVRLWGAVVAHVPPTLAAAPLCLLGMAAWVVGAGALLNCCCERLTRVDPDYSMGRVLAEISEQAIPPRRWEEIGRDIQDELRAEFASLSG